LPRSRISVYGERVSERLVNYLLALTRKGAGTRLGAIGRLLPAVLLLAAAALAGAQGTITSTELVETLSTAGVDKAVAELFEQARKPAAAFAVDCYTLRFRSRYPADSPASVTAQVFLPRSPGRTPPAIYLFAPGSTGLVNACRPSREHIAGIHWGLYRDHVLAFAGQGFVGVLPDYLGFGDPGRLQPYMSAVAEGRMVLDAIRATRNFLKSNPPVFVAGFSQGGHAIFAAADLERSYAPEVRITGIIGYGPTTNLEAMFREFPVVAPMAVYTFSQMYGTARFDPKLILASRWVGSLARDVTRQCVGGMQQYYPWSARELFQPAFADALFARKLGEKYPQIHRILQENSTGLGRHRIPCLILQGTDDVVIHPATQEEFVRQLCRAGSAVRYVLYRGSRHDTRQIGYFEALDWMLGLAGGGQPPSNCRDFGG
jgi:pimeloyl-ACP methyl ester carboxylesterase